MLKITIEGESKEIAALVSELRERHDVEISADGAAIAKAALRAIRGTPPIPAMSD